MNAHLKHDHLKQGFTTVYLPKEDGKKDDAGNAVGATPVVFFRGKASVDGQLHAHLKSKGLV